MVTKHCTVKLIQTHTHTYTPTTHRLTYIYRHAHTYVLYIFIYNPQTYMHTCTYGAWLCIRHEFRLNRTTENRHLQGNGTRKCIRQECVWVQAQWDRPATRHNAACDCSASSTTRGKLKMVTRYKPTHRPGSTFNVRTDALHTTSLHRHRRGASLQCVLVTVC